MRIGFRPDKNIGIFDPAASSLSANRTKLVAVIVPTIDHAIFSKIVAGQTSVLENANQSLLIAYNGYSIGKEETLVERFMACKVSGMVLVGQSRRERTRQLLQSFKTPAVELLECDGAAIDMAIGFSNFDAWYEITMGLVNRGRRHIGFISALPDGNDRVQRRLQGYLAALKDAGLATRPAYVAHAGFFIEYGRQAFAQMYEAALEIDAVVSNDILGLGVQLQCSRMNLSVPRDIAITGFDNPELSSILKTRLTTVRIEGHALGAAAGTKLLVRQSGQDADEPVVDLQCETLWRETTP